MLLSPDEIEAREFLVSLRGYDRDEVAAFLTRVAEDVRALQDRIAELEDHAASAAAAPVPPATVAAPSPEAADPSALFAEIGKETQRILEAAQQAGEELKRSARQEVDRDFQQARSNIAKLIAEGERRREAIDREVAALEQSRTQLTEELRGVARTIEHALRDLAPQAAAGATVREALATETADQPEPEQTAEQVAEEAEAAAEPVEPVELVELVERIEQVEPIEQVEQPPAAADEDRPADPLALRAEALSPLHPKLVRALKRGLQDLQNVTLDRVRRAGAKPDADALLPSADELAALSGISVELLGQAWEHGLAAAATLAGTELKAPDRRDGLDQRFGEDAGERVASQLGATLRMGVRGGEDSTGLSDRVGAAFGELKGPLAEELAATHLIYAYELGLLDAWRASGITERRWVLGKEPRCPEGRCRSNDQAGALASGTEFPSGHEVPPVHVGCTCTTIPAT